MRSSSPSRHGLAAALALAACTVPAHAAGVVGTGTAASCTEAALNAALAGGGTVTFNCGGPATIALTATKTLSQATDVDGGGLVTLDGGGAHQHFMLNNAVSYRLAGLGLVNGHTSNHGGAIFVNGATLRLENATLDNNEAVGPNTCGGAIVTANGAAVTLSQVVATNNRATYGGAVCTHGQGDTLVLSEFVATGNQAGEGGAIEHRGGALTVLLSLFVNNSATLLGGSGGAIAVSPLTMSTLAISNSTFAGNTGANGTSGSAISVQDVLGGMIENSTFAGNGGSGSAIGAFAGAAVTLKNTLVSSAAGSPERNCLANSGGSIIDGGNNLQFGGSTPQSCGAAIPVQDPLLAPLANNGGFSQTLALQAGSPAIDAGSGCTPFDQRGVTRPIGPACDIGAFEAPLAAPPAGGGQATSVPALSPWGLPLLAALLGVMGLRQRRKG